MRAQALGSVAGKPDHSKIDRADCCSPVEDNIWVAANPEQAMAGIAVPEPELARAAAPGEYRVPAARDMVLAADHSPEQAEMADCKEQKAEAGYMEPMAVRTERPVAVVAVAAVATDTLVADMAGCMVALVTDMECMVVAVGWVGNPAVRDMFEVADKPEQESGQEADKERGLVQAVDTGPALFVEPQEEDSSVHSCHRTACRPYQTQDPDRCEGRSTTADCHVPLRTLTILFRWKKCRTGKLPATHLEPASAGRGAQSYIP